MKSPFPVRIPCENVFFLRAIFFRNRPIAISSAEIARTRRPGRGLFGMARSFRQRGYAWSILTSRRRFVVDDDSIGMSRPAQTVKFEAQTAKTFAQGRGEESAFFVTESL